MMTEKVFNIICICAMVIMTIICVMAIGYVSLNEEKERIDPRGQVLKSSTIAYGGIAYFPKTCTIEILREHKEFMKTMLRNDDISVSPQPPCVFSNKQHEIDLYVQLQKEDSGRESHNAPLTSNGGSRSKDTQWVMSTNRPQPDTGPLLAGSNIRYEKRYIYVKGPCVPDESNKGSFKCGPIDNDEGSQK